MGTAIDSTSRNVMKGLVWSDDCSRPGPAAGVPNLTPDAATLLPSTCVNDVLGKLIGTRISPAATDSERSRKATKDLFGLSLISSLSHCCLFLEVVLLTRGLGPEQYGLLSFALTVQSYLFLFSGTGLRPISVREGVQNPERLDNVVTSYLVLAAGVSGVLGLLGL